VGPKAGLQLTAIVMAIEWRLLRQSDIGAAAELNRIAGWNQTERDWFGYLEFEPDGCFAVLMDGQLAGTAATIRYGLELGWIGMVLVDPRFRRLGLGTQLLQRAISFLHDKGTRSIRLDATPMGRKVYLPLGFKDEYEVVRLEGAGGPARLERDSSGLEVQVSMLEDSDLSSVERLDREAFGASRPNVLGNLRRRNPEYCFVARDRRGISGYLIARQGREAIQVGPSVARNDETAEILFSTLLSAVATHRVFLDILPSHRFLWALAKARKFVVQRSFTRMVLGDPLPMGRSEWIVATSGAEKG
jgi:GNAT superfamily N-acetyltransferase